MKLSLANITMNHLKVTSWALVALGVLAFVSGALFDLDEVWQLAGLLLVIAGTVKVAVVHLWVNVAGLGTDRHDPIQPL
jgi:hypothetical protein